MYVCDIMSDLPAEEFHCIIPWTYKCNSTVRHYQNSKKSNWKDVLLDDIEKYTLYKY